MPGRKGVPRRWGSGDARRCPSPAGGHRAPRSWGSARGLMTTPAWTERPWRRPPWHRGQPRTKARLAARVLAAAHRRRRGEGATALRAGTGPGHRAARPAPWSWPRPRSGSRTWRRWPRPGRSRSRAAKRRRERPGWTGTRSGTGRAGTSPHRCRPVPGRLLVVALPLPMSSPELRLVGSWWRRAKRQRTRCGHDRRRALQGGHDHSWVTTTVVVLSGLPEVLRVMDRATGRGGGGPRKQGNHVATSTHPATRPPTRLPQRTSSPRLSIRRSPPPPGPPPGSPPPGRGLDAPPWLPGRHRRPAPRLRPLHRPTRDPAPQRQGHRRARRPARRRRPPGQQLHRLTTRQARAHGRFVAEGLEAAGMLHQRGLPGPGLDGGGWPTPRRWKPTAPSVATVHEELARYRSLEVIGAYLAGLRVTGGRTPVARAGRPTFAARAAPRRGGQPWPGQVTGTPGRRSTSAMVRGATTGG